MSEIPSIDLKQIAEIFDAVFTVLGLILNFLLMYLIIKKTSDRLKDYQKILLQNCVIALIYNCAYGVTRAQPDFKYGNIFVIITSAFGRVPLPYNCFLTCFWIFALFFCVISLPVQFIYRYILIVKNQKLENYQYFAMLFTSFFLAFTYAGACVYLFWPQANYEEKGKLLDADIYYFKEIPNYVTADVTDLRIAGLLLYSYLIVTASYGIIIWANYKVWKHLKAIQSTITTQAKDANQQITKTMITQALLPVIVTLFPIAVIVTMIFLRVNVDGLSIGISFLFSWIPIVNSLITIHGVSCYRDAVLRMLHIPTKNNKSIPVSVVTVIKSPIMTRVTA